jgi:hypothetical protein
VGEKRSHHADLLKENEVRRIQHKSKTGLCLCRVLVSLLSLMMLTGIAQAQTITYTKIMDNIDYPQTVGGAPSP